MQKVWIAVLPKYVLVPYINIFCTVCLCSALLQLKGNISHLRERNKNTRYWIAIAYTQPSIRVQWHICNGCSLSVCLHAVVSSQHIHAPICPDIYDCIHICSGDCIQTLTYGVICCVLASMRFHLDKNYIFFVQYVCCVQFIFFIAISNMTASEPMCLPICTWDTNEWQNRGRVPTDKWPRDLQVFAQLYRILLFDLRQNMLTVSVHVHPSVLGWIAT